MNTIYLETFVVVAEFGSMPAAAQRLDITAAAVARRIRALENELGVSLVARAGRSVHVTPDGVVLLGKSKDFLWRVRELYAVSSNGDLQGELKIGALESALAGIIPKILVAISHEHPGIDIHLESGIARDLYQKVLSNDLDGALVVRPPFDVPKSAVFQLLFQEPHVLMVPASETKTNVLDILKSQPFIRYDHKQWAGQLVAEFMERVGVVPNVRFELGSLDAISLLVDRGLGVSIVPDWFGPRLAGINVKTLPLPAPTPVREIGLIQMRGNARSRLIDVFLASARACSDQTI